MRISAAVASLASRTTSLLSRYLEGIKAAIRILEQVHHGLISRHSRGRAAHLATVSRALLCKLVLIKSQINSQIYSAENREMLVRKAGDLEDEERRLGVLLGRKEDVLGGYERLGRGMEKVVEGFWDVEREIAKVKEEIERLEGA